MADLGKNVGGNIGRLGIVAAGHAVEHGNQGAAQRVRGNAHDAGVDAFKLRDQAGAVSNMIDAAPDDQDQHQAHQAERLNAQTGDGAAAQGDFYGFTDGKRFPCTVGRADVGIGCALHAQNADRAGHDRADQECNAACFLNKQRENNGKNSNDNQNGPVFREHKGVCAGTDDAGHFHHFRCAFTHGLDLAIVHDNINQCAGGDEKGKDPCDHHKQTSRVIR